MNRTIQQLFDLKGKTALVTGGSRGLGLQMAQALGEAGAPEVFLFRRQRGQTAGLMRFEHCFALQPLSGGQKLLLI